MKYSSIDDHTVRALYQFTSESEREAAAVLFPDDNYQAINSDKEKRGQFIAALGVLFPDMPVIREHDVYNDPQETDPLYLRSFNRGGGPVLGRGFTIAVQFAFDNDSKRSKTGNLYVFNAGTGVNTSIDIATAFDYHAPQNFGMFYQDYTDSVLDDVVMILGKAHSPRLEGPRRSKILSDGIPVRHFVAQVTYHKEIAALYQRAREILRGGERDGWDLSEWASVRGELHSSNPLQREAAEKRYYEQLGRMMLRS